MPRYYTHSSRGGSDLSTCTVCGDTLIWDWFQSAWVHVDTGQQQCANWTEEDEVLLQWHYQNDPA